MTPVEAYLEELAARLQVRGRRRRRILAECAGHLEEAAAERGAATAVGAFGPAGEVAAALDLEAAAGRGATATGLSAAGVSLTAMSTLVLINAGPATAAAPAPLAVVVLVAAQIAAVAAAAGLVQAVAQRKAPPSAASLGLLARRNATALIAAGIAISAAGAALPGRSSAALLLAGPLGLALALGAVARARRLARALPGGRDRIAASPLDDLGTAVGIELAVLHAVDPLRHAVRSATAVAFVAAAALFARQLGEGSAPAAAGAAAALEAGAVVVAFVVLGPLLGLCCPGLRGSR